MRNCPFCGSGDIRIEAIAADGLFAFARAKDGGIVALNGDLEPMKWADLNHFECHFCNACTAEFDVIDQAQYNDEGPYVQVEVSDREDFHADG